MPNAIGSFARLAARVLDAQSQQEREKRTAHAFALLLVAAVATVNYVTGMTSRDARFTLYALAIAASAARGGFAPGIVATLAAILVATLGARPPVATMARLLFAAEGLSLALIVSAIRSRLRRTEARLAEAEARVADLRLRDRHGRLLDAALRHLEDTARETAVIVLNEGGMITEWRGSAERLYGYCAEQLVGASAASLFFNAPSAIELSALLSQAVETGSLRRSDVHRRRDGGRVHVDLEIKPFHDDARGFTLTVHDIARRREWDDYREAAARAQVALEQAADETRQRLAALESLTDPSLNPLEGPATITELLERLRATIGADGAALVQRGRVGTRVVAARGLEPIARVRPIGADALRLTPGRVAVVHNDPARVEHLSALSWSAAVASLMVVPVVHNGQVWSTIEVVSERSRRASDWDVALVRIVADRLAAVVVQDGGLAATGS